MSMTSNINGSDQGIRVRRCRPHPYHQQAIPKYIYIWNNSHGKLNETGKRMPHSKRYMNDF